MVRVFGPMAPPSGELDCMTRAPKIDGSGSARCVAVILEEQGGACTCDASHGLVPLAPEHASILAIAKDRGLDTSCPCEIVQLTGDARNACQNDPSEAPSVLGVPVDGFCYLDAESTPPIGNAELLEHCSASERRTLRIAGVPAQRPEHDALLAVCESRSCGAPAE